jgi:prepilin-type processing-associated H-X9-DG protein
VETVAAGAVAFVDGHVEAACSSSSSSAPRTRVANVAQPNSVYQTIEALRRAGLIAVWETARDERRPERTVYEITSSGQDTLQRWLRTMLAEPAREFPDFPAALSLLPLLDPETVRGYLAARAEALAERLRSSARTCRRIRCRGCS